ncbi:DUF1178 family protein [Mariluticola halotolerans]|uniref:DUF1178 family protein n=1 Tax=Mariluticola halotolerans TaxID=2909283 RepID=UPI0026E1B29E|nr:DUF1178 family protein [Mariluticola halotolerans]UJQ93852.1 DUF1178 family protein [Mariluticola halotolerans]
MIQYSLICESEHKFDAWFRNADAYEAQHKKGIVTCPICSSGNVTKALMAPAVARKSSDTVALSSGHPQQAELRAAMKALRDKVTAEADYVGDRFASEARKIHDQESEKRGIYGEATREEVTALVEDGIDFMPLPSLPEDRN